MKAGKIFYVCLLFPCLLLRSGFVFDSENSRVRLGESGSQLVLNTAIVGWNGTLEIADTSPGRVSGQSISFSGGCLECGSLRATVTAKYDPTNSDKIMLEGDGRVCSEPGTILPSVEVQGTGNLIEGQPSFSSSVILAEAEPTAELTLALQGILDKDVTLNRGKIILSDDLVLGNAAQIIGEGTVDCAGMSLIFSGSIGDAWDTALTFSHAFIELKSRTVLENSWTFTHSEQDAMGESHINGNGEILDMSSSSAELKVADYHTLYITDCYLKGLGDSTGTFSMMGPNAVVKMSNVTMSLFDDYTFDHGQIVVDSSGCVFVTGGSVITFTWNEADSTVGGIKYVDKGDPLKIIGTLTVDGVTLYYDVLDQADANNIVPHEADNEYLRLQNSGIVARSLAGGVGGTIISNSYYNSTRNIDSGIGQEVYFNKPTGQTTWDITFDGGGYYIHFPSEYSGVVDKPITIDDGVTVTFKNVVFKDFDPSFIKKGIGSNYYFGEGTIIELARGAELTEPWIFLGDSIIDGQGSTFNLNVDDAVGIAADATLTLKDIEVTGVADGAGDGRIYCQDSTSTLALCDCRFILENAYTFSVGSIDCCGRVTFSNSRNLNVYKDTIVSPIACWLKYSSSGAFTVKSYSTVLFNNDFIFYYYASTRDRIVLEGKNSVLHWKGCYVWSDSAGFSLDTGTLIIDDRVFLKSSGVLAAAPEFASSLNVKILSGAILELPSSSLLKV